MVTLTPARMLHMDNHLGRLTAGSAADIVLFDSDINVKTDHGRWQCGVLKFADRGIKG